MPQFKRLLIGILLFALLGSSYVLFFGEHSTPYSPKAAASTMLTTISQSKEEIESIIKTKGFGSDAIKLIKIPVATVEYGIDEVFIGRYGTVIAHNRKFDVIVIMEPRLLNEKIVWSCGGFPVNALPKSCLENQ